MISTAGNCEYGSYWYVYLDGTIEYEMKATSIINTVTCEPGKLEEYGIEVSPVTAEDDSVQPCANSRLRLIPTGIFGRNPTRRSRPTRRAAPPPPNRTGRAAYRSAALVIPQELERQIGRMT